MLIGRGEAYRYRFLPFFVEIFFCLRTIEGYGCPCAILIVFLCSNYPQDEKIMAHQGV